MIALLAAVLSVFVGLFAASKAARTSAGDTGPAATAAPPGTAVPTATAVPAATTAPAVSATAGSSSPASDGLSSPWQALTGYALKWTAVNGPGGQVPPSYTIETLQLNGVKVDQFTTTKTRALEYGKGGAGLHPGWSYQTYVWANDGPAAPPHATIQVALPSSNIWQPPQKAEWQWEISSPLSLNNTYQMGTGITAWNGDKPQAANPVIYDIDAIINPASTVSALHAKGLHVIAYLEVGSIGNYYSAADEGISTTYYSQLKSAGDLGGNLPGWDETFININSPSSLSIIESMIKQQAAAKGFDAVETDLDTTFNNNDGQTPWTITESTEVEYMTAIANYCHSLGLGWIAKNLDETGNTAFIAQLEPLAQGMISEQNRQYGTYIYFTPFLNHHKWIGDAEYTLPLSSFAPQDNATNVNGVLFQQNLDGSRVPAR
jgi:Glycoside-hydrolase family GH114